MSLIAEWSSVKVPVIGMLHAPPLPGSPRCQGNFDSILQFVLHDAESLCDGGVNGLMLENFGDTPFFPDRVPAITVASMTFLACEVRRRFNIPLGINVLRNDGRSAMAIAAVCRAQFIRVNVLCGARVTDQGLIQGIAHDLLRDRAALKCEQIRVLADVDVKHSAALAPRSLDAEISDVVERGHADGIIISGEATGRPTEAAKVSIATHAAPTVPVLVGSGVTFENAATLISAGATGLIVGNSLKHQSQISNPIDPKRVRDLMQEVKLASS